MLEASGQIEVEEEDPVRAFRRLWKNEHECPCLLPYDTDTVSIVLDLLANQADIIAALPRTPDTVLSVRIYQLERDRLAFQLASYHRMRLQKISRSLYYYSGPGQRLLSPAEADFADQLRAAFERELQERTLRDFPASEQLFPPRQNMLAAATAKATSADTPVVDAPPSDQRHVVVRVREDVHDVSIDPAAPEERHHFLPNDIILLQYRVARPLILDERAECI